MKIKRIIFKYRYGLGAIAIILANFFLRFHELGIKPTWYTDEGSTLNVDWNLIHGQLRYLEIKYTFIPHLPLFYFLSSFFVVIFGKTILAIRLFANICIIASMSIAYFTGKELGGKRFGLSSVAILFVFSAFFITARYALLSSLNVLEISLVAFFSIKYIKTEDEKWIRWLAFVLACALMTEAYLWGMVIVLPVLLWPHKKKLLAESATLSVLPLFIFFVVMIIISGKGFINDMSFYYFSRFFSNLNYSAYSPAEKLANIFNFWVGHGFWNFAGPIGLFFIPGKKVKRLIIILFLLIAMPIFSFVSLSFLIRNQVLFMYLASFGAVSLIFWLCALLLRKFDLLGKFSRYFIIAIFSLAVIKSFQSQIADDYGFSMNYNDFLWETGWTDSTVSFLNRNAGPDDYIISTNDNFVHLLNSKVANMAQAIAYQGMESSIYSPKFIDKERFYSDISIEKAKFVIFDKDYEKFFITDEPNIVKAFSDIDSWPTVFEAGHYTVKQNPAIR